MHLFRLPRAASWQLAATVLLFCTAHANAQRLIGCFSGGNGCSVQPAPEPDWLEGWYASTEPGRLLLYSRGVQVGSLDPVTGNWRTAGKSHTVDLVEKFGLAESTGRGPAAADPFPGGVDRSGMQGPAYQISGRPATKAQVEKLLTGGSAGIEDDRSKPFLTAVLDEPGRKQFLADWQSSAALAPWRGKVHLNVYAPDDWHATQVGLANGVSFQAPADGSGTSKVLFRFRSYAGPEALAQALRQCDPNYKPDTDPDPTKPKPAKDPGSSQGKVVDLDENETSLSLGGLALFNVGMFLRRRYSI